MIKSPKKSSLRPEDVFTPRGELKQNDMYVSRGDLENALRRSLRSPKHVVIHGESGCGKSWMYKRVFSEDGVFYRVVNLGRASAAGSILSLIESTLARDGWAEKTSYTVEKEATAGIGGFGGRLSTEGQYKVAQPDAFEKCIELIRKSAGKGKSAALVFDNLEHIFDSESLIKELAGLLLLVDDDNYSKHQVKIVLVGTPNDIRSYISKVSKSNTITNRLSEVPEVSRLQARHARDLVSRGLFAKLKYRVVPGTLYGAEFDESFVPRTVAYYSDLIPQYVQELGLHIAMRTEENHGLLSSKVFDLARHDWVRESLVSELAVLEANLNSRSTKIGRKNQVIFALAKCQSHDFSSGAIEKIVREEFKHSCGGVTLNIAQTMSELASAQRPMIRRTPSGKSYRFIDPKLRIVIRVKFIKLADEGLELRTFEDSISTV